jgi:uncharacterized protein YggL (DUF469 family)
MIQIEVDCIDEKIELLERIKVLQMKMKKSRDKEGDKMFDEDELQDFPFYIDPFHIKVTTEESIQRMINKLIDEYWESSDFQLGFENEKYYVCHKKEKHIVDLGKTSTWDDYRDERIKLKNFFESL